MWCLAFFIIIFTELFCLFGTTFPLATKHKTCCFTEVTLLNRDMLPACCKWVIHFFLQWKLTQTNGKILWSWRNHPYMATCCSRVFQLHHSLQETGGTIHNWKHTELERHHSKSGSVPAGKIDNEHYTKRVKLSEKYKHAYNFIRSPMKVLNGPEQLNAKWNKSFYTSYTWPTL